jgi:hypothetical protein
VEGTCVHWVAPTAPLEGKTCSFIMSLKVTLRSLPLSAAHFGDGEAVCHQ